MEPRKTYKTYRFKNMISYDGSLRGSMTNPEHAPVQIGSPPEFKGAADVWCPEELLIGAVNSCLMLTFLAYVQRHRLEIASFESYAEGVVENAGGKYRVTQITVRPTVGLKLETDIPLAKDVLKRAKEDCFISNSVSSAIELAPQFKF